LSDISTAHDYQRKIEEVMSGRSLSRATRTSEAGNGQGRNGKWKAGETTAIRVPNAFAKELLETAKRMDENFLNKSLLK
jgi:hypothetical protein